MSIRSHALGLALTLTACASLADPVTCPTRWAADNDDAPRYSHEIIVSPALTYHWHPSPEHRPVVLGGYLRYAPGNTYCGISLFTNSFGQPSASVYVGKTWEGIWPAQPQVYASLSLGMMYGYVGEFKHKVPLNLKGFSPVAVPALGYRIDPQKSVQLFVLGNSALMLNYAYRF